MLGKNFVKTIQEGLSDAYTSRIEDGLSFSNLKWNSNNNHIFSALEKKFANGNLGLDVRLIRRCGYSMPCFYEKNTKTLYSIISKARLNSLRKRKIIEKPHYTDALCLLSKNEGSHFQLNIFGEPVIKTAPTTIKELLDQLTMSFDGFEIDKYALITCSINHYTCELNEVMVHYMSKNYDIVETDTSWNKHISMNYDTLIEEDRNYETKEFDIPVTLKNDVKLKSEKEDEIQMD